MTIWVEWTMAGIARRRTANGVRYDVRYRLPDGHQLCKTFRTKKEAESFARNAEVDVDRGVYVDPREARRTFSEVAREWLESNPNKRPSSRNRDRLAINKHVTDAFRAQPIGAIRPADVQAQINAWCSRTPKPLSPGTVKRSYGTVRAVFRMATDRDIIAKSPCRGIKLPRVDPKTRLKLQPEQVAAITGNMAAADALAVWIAALGGLRWGEVFGLRVRDVDLDGKKVTVSGTLARGDGGVTIYNPPKSMAGVRTLAVPGQLATMLRRHLAVREITADPDALLFATREGTPHDINNWRRRQWDPAIEKAGLSGVTFHDLRRFNATELVRAGVDLKTAQQRLGHSDARLTLEVYAQAHEAPDRDAADALGARLFRPPVDEHATDDEE